MTRQTPNLSNVQVVVLALYRLKGAGKSVDTEDIAVEANRMAPGRFSWRKYTDQISLEHIRVFLSDAKKEKNGALVTGDGTAGWRLTKAGLDAAESAVGKPAARKVPRLRKQDELRLKNESARIQTLSAWEKFLSGRSVSIREAEAVFRVNEYVLGKRKTEQVERIRILFDHDREFGEFVEQMATLIQDKRNRK